MEMIYGDSLQMVNPRSEKEAVGWMLQLAKILDYLHNLPKPVIHRDIKPSNLILRHNPEEIVLIDFGAVKEVTQKPGTRIATAGYGSPEQKKRIILYTVGFLWGGYYFNLSFDSQVSYKVF